MWLRVQALIVMSATVPHRLVELLPRLLASAGNEAVLVDQMLLDCWRLLLRAPGNLPIDVAQLRHSLQKCRDYLESQRTGPDADLAGDHLHVVRDLLTIADYRILSKPQEPQEAWERLNEDLVRPVVRHSLEAGLLLVRGFVEDVERVEPSAETARAAETDWDTCVRQLEERVLANLPPLRQIIAGDFVSDWLGRQGPASPADAGAAGCRRTAGGHEPAPHLGPRAVAAGRSGVASGSPRAAGSHQLVEPHLPGRAPGRP